VIQWQDQPNSILSDLTSIFVSQSAPANNSETMELSKDVSKLIVKATVLDSIKIIIIRRSTSRHGMRSRWRLSASFLAGPQSGPPTLEDCNNIYMDYEEIVKFFDEYTELVRSLERYSTGQPLDEALWRCFIMDTAMDGSRPAPGKCGEQLRAMQDWFRLLLQERMIYYTERDVYRLLFTWITSPLQSLHFAKVRSSYSTLTRKRDQEFDAVIRSRTAGLGVALTKNLGYLAWVPEEAQRNEVIAFLANSDVPYVLRYSTEDEAYRILGACYVHGLMSGQVESGQVEDTTTKLDFGKTTLC
jgi:hypothetical protein